MAPSLAQTRYGEVVRLANFFFTQPGTAGEAQASHLQVVLDRHGHAMQLTQVAVRVLPAHLVLHLRVLAGVVQVEGDVGVEQRVDSLDAPGQRIDHRDGGDASLADAGGQFDRGQKTVVVRKCAHGEPPGRRGLLGCLIQRSDYGCTRRPAAILRLCAASHVKQQALSRP